MPSASRKHISVLGNDDENEGGVLNSDMSLAKKFAKTFRVSDAWYNNVYLALGIVYMVSLVIGSIFYQNVNGTATIYILK